MKDRAYAKINLALNVKKRRDDGYHDLEMIMLPLCFYDEIKMTPAKEMSYHSNCPFLCFNEKNTVVKMIRYLKEHYGITQNFSVEITKHIPMRAGLAGGSSDAASVLRLMEKLCHLSLSKQERLQAALAVGADVPFCLYNKPALVQGIGEKLSFFSLGLDFYILLVKPRQGISTADAFRHLALEDCDHPDVYALRKCLVKGEYEASLPYIQNSLESSSFQLETQLKTLKQRLLQEGCDAVAMSGSGSTVFGISQNKELIEKIAKKMKQEKYFVRKTTIFHPSSSRIFQEKHVK